MGELILAICTENVPPLASLAPWVNGSLAAAVDRALVRALDARTPSARDFRLGLVPHAHAGVLRRDDLVQVPPAIRASAPMALARTVAMNPRDSEIASASLPMVASRTAVMRKGPSWAGWSLAALAALAVCAGIVLVAFRLKPEAFTKKGTTATSIPAPTEAVATPAPLPSISIATPTAESAPKASAVPEAGAPERRPLAGLKPPRQTTTTTTTAGASPSSPPTNQGKDGTGRGMTATDLPP
jgi:serine/threonine-protein kinase